MKIQHSVELKPFMVPSHAIVDMRDYGKDVDQSIPLKSLSVDTLAALCDEFRREVFAKAGKKDPQK